MFERCLHLDLPPHQSSFLWGARKTGKSTYLNHVFLNSFYIDLLKSDTFRKYSLNPHYLREELTIQDIPNTIIIDEVQKVPLLLDEVHWLIENTQHRFILCGSSARKLKSLGSNFLGGRAWRYHMLPLCYPELKTLDFQKIFNHGLIPQHYLSSQPQKYLNTYLFDYLVHEVQQEANLRKSDPFTKFIDILGFCQGEMINFTNIARECGVNVRTVKNYFDICEDMFIGYFVTPYRKKAKRQTIQETPKFYLFDTGIANYLKRYTFVDFYGSQAGQAFEHYVFLELMAYKTYQEKRDSIHYWRTKEGFEVDFVIQDQGYEVKMNDSFSNADIRGLLTFGKEYGAKLNIITNSKVKRKTIMEGQEITIWPIQDFLSALWGGEIWV